MVMDECPKNTKDYKKIKTSMELSTEWARRSKEEFGINSHKALFGIIQGGLFKDLRNESLAKLISIEFDGYAIGGLAVGEGQEKMLEVLDYLSNKMPQNSPRYLMGVGKPSDLVECVTRGVDMFDCVYPTRSGRTGQALTNMGAININNSRHVDDPRPLDFNCGCYTCKNYSRAYLNHVKKANEIISSMLITWHNLFYYQELMNTLRESIKSNTLEKARSNFYQGIEKGDYERL